MKCKKNKVVFQVQSRCNRMLFINYLFVFITTQSCLAKVSDNQYASMPAVFHQDNYDKCMLLEDEALYCSFTYKMRARNNGNTNTWKIIQEVSSNSYNYRHDHLRHWICVPFTCPKIDVGTNNHTRIRQDIQRCYDEKYAENGLIGEIENLKCDTNVPEYPMDALDITVAIIFILYASVVIFATIYEGSARYKSEGEYRKITSTGWRRIISAFSIPRNWHRLTTVRSTPDVDKLRPIQGVRFYNIIIVILSHSVMVFFFGPVANTKYTETMTKKFGTVFLSSGPLCVSTFFWMSSFFLLYGLFTQFENKEMKLKHLLWAFVDRYIRLTPCVAVMVAFYASWWRHIGTGPLWNSMIGREYLRCRKNWWTNLLYLNNFVDSGNMCLAQTWYLALDTQYFIILLLLVWIMKKNEKLVWPILCSVFVLTITATFWDNYRANYEALIIPLPEKMYDMKMIMGNPQWHSQLVSWKGNIIGCIVGLGYGYLFYKNKNKTLFKKNMTNQIVYHIVTYGLPLGVIILPGLLIFNFEVDHDPFWASFHVAFGRPIFSSAIGFIMFGAIFGLGGITKSVMEWPPSYVLGRLSYSASMVNGVVILSRAASSRFPVYISDLHVLYYFLGDLATCFVAAFFMTLLVELPISDLQKLLIPAKDEKKEK